MSSTARKPIFPVAVTAASAHSKAALLQVLVFLFSFAPNACSFVWIPYCVSVLKFRTSIHYKDTIGPPEMAFRWQADGEPLPDACRRALLCLCFPLCQSFQLLVCTCD